MPNEMRFWTCPEGNGSLTKVESTNVLDARERSPDLPKEMSAEKTNAGKGK